MPAYLLAPTRGLVVLLQILAHPSHSVFAISIPRVPKAVTVIWNVTHATIALVMSQTSATQAANVVTPNAYMVGEAAPAAL